LAVSRHSARVCFRPEADIQLNLDETAVCDPKRTSKNWQWPRQMSAPNEMKISPWKDLAELLALMAVVGGLVAVVFELRQTQSALSAQAYQTRALDVIDTMRE